MFANTVAHTDNILEISAGGQSKEGKKCVKGERSGDRIASVFKSLYASENPVLAVHSALALVAEAFSFERSYIFETSKDGRTTSNTFEWCAKRVAPRKEMLQNIPIEMLESVNGQLQETGRFILRTWEDMNPEDYDFLGDHSIGSILQFGIFDNNNLLGFMGFDNCKREDALDALEIDEITTICNLLETFFVKQRIARESAENLDVLTEVLDHLGNFIYIINTENFEVLFTNEKIRSAMEIENIHEPCYRFFRGMDVQCPDCPVRNLADEGVDKAVCEMYNEKMGMWIETTASPLRWIDGSTVFLINCLDISKQRTEYQKYIKKLERLTYVDELTGSRTYHKFMEDAQRILEEEPDDLHLLVKLDIDNFKLVNGQYGYAMGNVVLCKVAEAIGATLRNEREIFARKSNDEFIVLFQIETISEITKRHNVFLERFEALIGDELAFKFNFPHGRYIVKRREIENCDVTDMFERVNFAHKAAKQDKFRQFVYYDDGLTKDAMAHKEIENKMEKALQDEDFVVYLQPKYYLEDKQIGGAEALVRWQKPDGELLLPGDFIPIFERNGFIIKLDLYVLKKVCGIIKGWIEAGIPPVVVSVNFSRLHLRSEGFVKTIGQIVDSCGIDRKYIELEITETAAYDNIEVLETLLDELHASRFTLSMDDFGSGYSSLCMLKNLPVDVIKMDRSFLTNQKDIGRAKTVLGSVIEMADRLGARIIAEGVEEKEDVALLHELHCEMVQGFYFARPMPEANFNNILKEQYGLKNTETKATKMI